METNLVSCPRTVLAGAAVVVVVLAAVWDLGRRWVIPKKQTLCGLHNLPKNGNMPQYAGDSGLGRIFVARWPRPHPRSGVRVTEVVQYKGGII